MAKLKQLHPIVLVKVETDVHQLRCPCGWEGTRWLSNHPHILRESNDLRTERILHLLEELDVIQGDTVRT